MISKMTYTENNIENVSADTRESTQDWERRSSKEPIIFNKYLKLERKPDW